MCSHGNRTSDWRFRATALTSEIDQLNRDRSAALSEVRFQRYLQNPESIDDIYEFSEGGQNYFPLTDALGSVVAISDSLGVVVRRNSYEVYGARTSTGTGPQWAYGFTGREQDGSGLSYNRNRFFMSRTGNWLSADRAGMIDGPNHYQYVRGQPSMATDPTGNWINTRDSDPLLLMLLYSAIDTRIGYQLYLALALHAQEVRFIPWSSVPPAGRTTRGGPAGGVTFWESLASANACSKYLAVSVDLAPAGSLWSRESLLVHELRHGVDMVYFGRQLGEPRAYAAQILADLELGVDFYDALSRVRAVPLYSPFTLARLRVLYFPDSVFDEARQVP